MTGKRMDLWDEMQGTMDAALIKKIAIITMFIDHATLSFLEVAKNSSMRSEEGSEGFPFRCSAFCWWRDSSIRAAE